MKNESPKDNNSHMPLNRAKNESVRDSIRRAMTDLHEAAGDAERTTTQFWDEGLKAESTRDSIKRAIDDLYAASDELTDKKDKDEVNYSKSDGSDRCGNCEYFEVERKNGCTKVKGLIEPEYWCEEYEGKEVESVR